MHWKKWINTDRLLPSWVARGIFVLKTTKVPWVLYCSVYLSADGLRMTCNTVVCVKWILLEIVRVLILGEILLSFMLAQLQTYHFLLRKVHPLYCGKGITKYNVFSKSCTWWTCPRESADPRENWQQEKLLGLEFSSMGWGTRSGWFQAVMIEIRHWWC